MEPYGVAMSGDKARSVLESHGSRKEDRSLFTMEFVNMNTSSRAEKERNSKVVRSIAMKSFRRRQRLERTQGKQSSRANSETQFQQLPERMERKIIRDRDSEKCCSLVPVDVKSGCHTDWRQGLSTQAMGDWIQTTCSDSGLEDLGVYNNCNGSDVDGDGGVAHIKRILGCPRSSNSSPLGSPITLLAGGRIDPFRVYPAACMSRDANELMDHSASLLWPGLHPGGADGASNKMVAAWLEKFTSNPLIMHVLLFGGSVHMDILRGPRINLNDPTRLFHKSQTIKLLREGLNDLEASNLDELILTVLILGANEVETMIEHMKPKARSPFHSPLSSSQWLDVYGSLKKVDSHYLAMRSLVDRRGGLENIQLEGLAEVLEYSNILRATQGLTKPSWPLLKRTARIDIICNAEIPYYPLRNLGKGFQTLQASGITHDAAIVLQGLAELTADIECYSRGVASVPDLARIIDRRNLVQYALMSLPTGGELELGESSSLHLYESIRYAAIIYSIAVTYPVPPMSGIYSKLTALLKWVLEESKSDLCWTLYPKALLWILTLGGIAASITADRYWYVQSLTVVSASLNISRWDDVVEEMGQYLWLERACDAGGHSLWLEVMRERCLDDSFGEDV